MLTVHHLGKSQSERIVWLCEELGVPYELKRYTRDPATILAPAEYKALHPIGAAPVITDGELVLAESGAVVDYIVAKYGNARLVLGPTDPAFAQFLYWLEPARACQRQSDPARDAGASRSGLRSSRRKASRGRISCGQRFHDRRYHDSFLAHHDALFPAL